MKTKGGRGTGGGGVWAWWWARTRRKRAIITNLGPAEAHHHHHLKPLPRSLRRTVPSLSLFHTSSRWSPFLFGHLIKTSRAVPAQNYWPVQCKSSSTKECSTVLTDWKPAGHARCLNWQPRRANSCLGYLIMHGPPSMILLKLLCSYNNSHLRIYMCSCLVVKKQGPACSETSNCQ